MELSILCWSMAGAGAGADPRNIYSLIVIRLETFPGRVSTQHNGSDKQYDNGLQDKHVCFLKIEIILISLLPAELLTDRLSALQI